MTPFFASPHRENPLRQDFVSPAQVLWHEGGVAGAEALLQPFDGQSSLAARPLCVLHGPAALLLDFGRELHGGIRIVTQNVNNGRTARIRLRFGESVSEAMNKPDNDHAVHDMTVDLPWQGSAEYGATGFRFVRLDLIEGYVEIRDFAATFVHCNATWRGAFRCSDDRLNAIWETAAWTVYLNMQEYVWDGIKRDRLVWAGDIHPESRVISAVFGEHPVLPKSLDRVRDETPLPRFMNDISSYSLWWVLTHYDWFRTHGNRAYLAEQREYLVSLLRQFQDYIAENGQEQLPEKRFLDWPSEGNPQAVQAGLQALLALGLARGAMLCETLGEAAEAQRCRGLAEKMHAYVPPLGQHKQSAALIALAGLDDPGQINREILAQNPLQGMATFYGYYVLEARALAGDHAGALQVIRDYWGAMLDLGATSFWEDFDITWVDQAARIDALPLPGKIDVHKNYGDHCYKGLRHSLCHGWAGGPAAWLSDHVLGVQPLVAGMQRVRITPHLADLDWAEGRYPTPHGDISVRHEKQADDSIATSIEAPDSIEVKSVQPDPQEASSCVS